VNIYKIKILAFFSVSIKQQSPLANKNIHEVSLLFRIGTARATHVFATSLYLKCLVLSFLPLPICSVIGKT
jgi:hypothetical protein